MIKEAIARIIDGVDMTQREAYDVMRDILSAQATPSQMAGFLVALRNKGETVQEIAGLAGGMRDSAAPFVVHPKNLVDCCGTGGDGQGGFNVSTSAAFVVAGAGLSVAKHGNRSISSHSGSADVLEMLGIRVDAPIACVENCLNVVGIAFLFAPQFHLSMKHVMPTRRELGIRTVFNILGPLTNPARTRVQLIGLASKELIPVIGKTLALLGHKAGLVVHSHGWDEITLAGPTQVCEMMNGKVKNYIWTNKDFGLPRVGLKDLKGGDPKQNADVILQILNGAKTLMRNVVVANAAALIWISERAYNNQKNLKLKDAVKMAEESIDSGRALKKCQQLAEMSHSMD